MTEQTQCTWCTSRVPQGLAHHCGWTVGPHYNTTWTGYGPTTFTCCKPGCRDDLDLYCLWAKLADQPDRTVAAYRSRHV